MTADGFRVDPEVLRKAATAIRRAVEDGTTETACFAWGDGYGHATLAQALHLFVSDVDLAVDGHAERAARLAGTLDHQADGYVATDASSGNRLDRLAARLSPGALATTPRTPFPGATVPTAPVPPFTAASR